MKTDQRGYMAYLALAITGAVILLILTGVFHQQKLNSYEPDEVIEPVAKSALVVDEPRKITEAKVTETDILRASYSLSAEFGTLATIPKNITFPPSSNRSELSGSVYITESGEVLSDASLTKRFERFYILKYEYQDDAETVAIVTIKGSNAERGFTVRNVDGQIITAPVSTF